MFLFNNLEDYVCPCSRDFKILSYFSGAFAYLLTKISIANAHVQFENPLQLQCVFYGFLDVR